MKLIIMRHGERFDQKGIAERDQCLTPDGDATF
jgi:phosphohistidine phosphatase SixA